MAGPSSDLIILGAKALTIQVSLKRLSPLNFQVRPLLFSWQSVCSRPYSRRVDLFKKIVCVELGIFVSRNGSYFQLGVSLEGKGKQIYREGTHHDVAQHDFNFSHYSGAFRRILHYKRLHDSCLVAMFLLLHHGLGTQGSHSWFLMKEYT